MTTKKVSLRLVVHEEALLKHLYAERRIATDEYMRRPAELEDLVTTFNNLTGRKDSPTDVLHYMVTRRKKSKLLTTVENGGAGRLKLVALGC